MCCRNLAAWSETDWFYTQKKDVLPNLATNEFKKKRVREKKR